VDPKAIAQEEGIILDPGDHGDGFDGRIEFLLPERRFVIYYQAEYAQVAEVRVRFSLAHELGHFYLESHRETLCKGEAHDSEQGLMTDKQREREADAFAASLLIPPKEIEQRMGTNRFLDMRKLVEMAMGILEDNMFAQDNLNRNDLRVQVPARSIVPFAEWYATRKGRESTPWREFHEELVDNQVLSADVFPYVQMQYLRQHNTGIQRSRQTTEGARFECRIAEIFELDPTPDQQNILCRLQEENDDRVMWATAEQIKTQGVVAKKQFEANIAETAEWIL